MKKSLLFSYLLMNTSLFAFNYFSLEEIPRNAALISEPQLIKPMEETLIGNITPKEVRSENAYPYKGFKVYSVETICNPWLLDLYEKQKKRILGDQAVSENTADLFFPCQFEKIWEVLHLGFRYMSPDFCFLNDLNKVDECFSPINEYIYVIWARVFLGKPFFKSAGQDLVTREQHDSIIDLEKGEFFICHKEQALPKYIIIIRRKLIIEYFFLNPESWNEDQTYDWAAEFLPLNDAKIIKDEAINGTSLFLFSLNNLKEFLCEDSALKLFDAINKLRR